MSTLKDTHPWLFKEPFVYKPMHEITPDEYWENVMNTKESYSGHELNKDMPLIAGQKVSEVSVEPTKDGKPPYTRKIKTEAETVRELKGESPITIDTRADPDYKDEDKTEESSDEKDDDDFPDPTN